MIRLLVKLGQWLDHRFPEKLVVNVENYMSLHAEVSMLRATLNDTKASLDKALERLSVVEVNAVHKGAVQDLVSAIKLIKEDYTSLKANLGFNRVGSDEIQAILNGEPLTPEEK